MYFGGFVLKKKSTHIDALPLFSSDEIVHLVIPSQRVFNCCLELERT